MQFRFALRIERVNPLAQGELDFRFAFAHTGEGTFGGVAARRDNALELAAADNVKAAAEPGEGAQDGEVGVGF